MKEFTRDERIMMMLYNPGTRAGLIAELEAMRLQLTPSEFDSLDLYPDI